MTDLAGLLVLSLEQAVAAPYASCRLADAGARVVKVEATPMTISSTGRAPTSFGSTAASNRCVSTSRAKTIWRCSTQLLRKPMSSSKTCHRARRSGSASVQRQ